ncbi:hypothetical protein [Conexibacter sp. SYSU D00693]|uniref:hypothetical protein n=1 Tax=Conexibacter sp. SYSU D00693 TaxID=2812560 RepID=UPI00196A84E0|nr:hypothetical protein [Conexibacter sp. SYSU D00693]
MEEAFFWVVVGVTGVAAVLALWAFAKRDEVYDQIGKGGLSLRDGSDVPLRPAVTGAAAIAERDAEVRQMLEARNRRRVARGEAPIDVEAELAALTRPAVDRELLLEIRELVESRNRRLVRQGKAPLDVEAEVARRLRDVGAG